MGLKRKPWRLRCCLPCRQVGYMTIDRTILFILKDQYGKLGTLVHYSVGSKSAISHPGCRVP